MITAHLILKQMYSHVSFQVTAMVKDIAQYLKLAHSLSPACILMCVFKETLLLYVHLYSLSPVSMLMCVFK